MAPPVLGQSLNINPPRRRSKPYLNAGVHLDPYGVYVPSFLPATLPEDANTN